jgi:uncharacterized protein with PIN domain
LLALWYQPGMTVMMDSKDSLPADQEPEGLSEGTGASRRGSGSAREDSVRPGGDTATVRFLVDSTAGRLARWLRLVGYDTAYSGAPADYRLVHRAMSEGRVLITRCGSAAALPWARAILLRDDRLEDQLIQVARAFPPHAPPLTRCSICNTPLEEIARESVRKRVPPYVYKTARSFSICPGCRHVYWPGTHHDRIKARWEALRRVSLAG